MSQTNRFSFTASRTYDENEPCGTFGTIVEAVHVIDPPTPEHTQFIIMESEWAMAHPNYYWCHCYSTEETMRAAFKAGLMKQLAYIEPPEQKIASRSAEQKILALLDPPRPHHYEGHEGYIRSFATDSDKAKPWFLAQVGQEISGDLVVELEKRSPDDMIGMAQALVATGKSVHEDVKCPKCQNMGAVCQEVRGGHAMSMLCLKCDSPFSIDGE